MISFLRKLYQDLREDIIKLANSWEHEGPQNTSAELSAEDNLANSMFALLNHDGRLDWDDMRSVWNIIAHQYFDVQLQKSADDFPDVSGIVVQKQFLDKISSQIAGARRDDFMAIARAMTEQRVTWIDTWNDRMEIRFGPINQVRLMPLKSKPTLSRAQYVATRFSHVTFDNENGGGHDLILDTAGKRWLSLIDGVSIEVARGGDDWPVLLFQCSSRLSVGFSSFLWVITNPDDSLVNGTLRNGLRNWMIKNFPIPESLDFEKLVTELDASSVAGTDFREFSRETVIKRACEPAVYGVFVAHEPWVSPGEAWIRIGFLAKAPFHTKESGATRLYRFMLSPEIQGCFSYAQDPDAQMRTWFAPYDAAGNPMLDVYFRKVSRTELGRISENINTPTELLVAVSADEVLPSDSIVIRGDESTIRPVPHFANELDQIWKNPMGTEKGFVEVVGALRNGTLDRSVVKDRDAGLTARGKENRSKVSLANSKWNLIRFEAKLPLELDSPYNDIALRMPPKDAVLFSTLLGDERAILLSENRQNTKRTLTNHTAVSLLIAVDSMIGDSFNSVSWKELAPKETWEATRNRFLVALVSDDSRDGVVLQFNLGTSARAVGDHVGADVLETRVSYTDRVGTLLASSQLLPEQEIVLTGDLDGSEYGAVVECRVHDEKMYLKAFAAGRLGERGHDPRISLNSSDVLSVLRTSAPLSSMLFHSVYYLERDGSYGSDGFGFHGLGPNDFVIFLMRNIPTLFDTRCRLQPHHVRSLIAFLLEYTVPHALAFVDLYDKAIDEPSDTRICENFGILLWHDTSLVCPVDLNGFGLAPSPDVARHVQGDELIEALRRSQFSGSEKRALIEEVKRAFHEGTDAHADREEF